MGRALQDEHESHGSTEQDRIRPFQVQPGLNDD